jgi:aryl-alcohol dehydrogenase-like predicted oxidoreductase
MSTLFPDASRLGFGCASLGSRVDARRGLRALAEAHERGINWFDLAPSYGDGQAETIFSEFVRKRRGHIHICTKCGIETPNPSPMKRLLRPLARGLVRRLPALRGAVARQRQAAAGVPLSPQLIRDSLHRSLKRLGVDRIDVLALHDPSPADAAREDIFQEMDALRRSGKVQAIGLAGAVELSLRAVGAAQPWSHLQFANGTAGDNPKRIRNMLGARADTISLATFSVFAGTSPASMRDDGRAACADAGYDYPTEQAWRAAQLDAAMLANPSGTVIVSMFEPAHLSLAAARLEAVGTADPERLFQVFAGAGHSASSRAVSPSE